MITSKQILVTEHDGLKTRTMNLKFLVDTERCTDLPSAVRKACNDFIGTPEGAKLFSYNCGCFNWADFWNDCPNLICEKYGFWKQEHTEADLEADWDEHLVTEDNLPFSFEEWEVLRDTLAHTNSLVLSVFLNSVSLESPGYREAVDKVLKAPEPDRARRLDQVRPYLPLDHLRDWYEKYCDKGWKKPKSPKKPVDTQPDGQKKDETAKPKKTATAVVAVTGRFCAEVAFDTMEMMKKRADVSVSEADFGELSVIDWKIDHFETEDGTVLDPDIVPY